MRASCRRDGCPVAVAVLLAALLAVGCGAQNEGTRQKTRRFYARASALGFRLPPKDVMNANLRDRNPCLYTVNLSGQLRVDPSYFSNRTAGLSTQDALRVTALEVAVFCPDRYRELRSFIRQTRSVVPSRRCLLKSCPDTSLVRYDP